MKTHMPLKRQRMDCIFKSFARLAYAPAPTKIVQDDINC
jgi:hypothetical protein